MAGSDSAHDPNPEGDTSESPDAGTVPEPSSAMERFGSEKYEDDGWAQLAAVLDKIPFVGGLQREASRLGRLVGKRRGPRLLLVGPKAAAADVLGEIVGLSSAPLVEEPSEGWCGVEGEHLSWRIEETASGEVVQGADIVLWLATDGDVPTIPPDENAALGAKSEKGKASPTSYVLLVCDDEQHLVSRREAVEAELKGSLGVFIALKGKGGFAAHVPQAGGDRGMVALREAMASAVAEEAAVEAARVFRASDARARVGDAIIQSASALATTVALAPVPLSDIVVIAPLQGMMVSSLCYLSGRRWNARTAAEWTASAGVVSGMGFGFRAVARQVVKLVPGAGSLVAGGIAGAGTLALGRSAKRYFLSPDGRALPTGPTEESASV